MENHCCSSYYLAYGVGGQHTTFTSCVNAACSDEFFLQRVDYDWANVHYFSSHLSNPLYCTWMLEMYHIRGQNSHYKKLVWNERLKEGSKNAPKANLTPCWHANVIFENVLKEGINIACKAYFAVWSIWTFDRPRVGGSQKVIPRERLPAPPHRVAR